MTDTHERDATRPGQSGSNGNANRAGNGERNGTDPPDGTTDSDRDDPGPAPDESVGVSIPDEHVGAFVAQAFEDVERDTDWADVVANFVPDGAREDWRALSATEQVAAVLRAAAGYDERATAALADIATDRGSLAPEDEARWQEATRLRRNADSFRDGVADAYADGHVDDEALVAAVEAADFDTSTVARREAALERVANAFGLDFRPYGGTLFDGDREPTDTEREEFTHWER